MNSQQIVRRVVLVAAAAAVVLLAGATSGFAEDNLEKCFDGGKAVCIEIDDTDGVSPSSATASHYMNNVVTIRNNTGSALTNLKITLTLTDRFDNPAPPALPTTKPSTADYVETDANGNRVSDAACAETAASNVLTCTAPNLGAEGTGSDSVTLQPLVFRTSNAAGVLATTMKVDVAAKEGGKEQPSPRDPTNEQFEWSEETSLEGETDAQRSWVFPGASVTLQTTNTVGQYSIFPITVPRGLDVALVAKLEESTPSAAFCAACFGQQVSTTATDIFSATRIVELQSVLPLGIVPSGTTEKVLTVRHLPDSGLPEDIKPRCSGEIDSGTPTTGLPCARVVINKKAGTLTIEAFSKRGNGQWGFF
jgi:hypothetical protein